MKNEMIKIDGSYGEGGGQIVRSSLALSLVTGRPFEIDNIRAGRKKPGLMRQHLTAVNAAAEVGCAKVTGNTIGSRKITFEPQTVNAGKYHFTIGSAGSTTLVLQTILPPLLVADKYTKITLEGGTHNPYAPPFDYLDKCFAPVINRMGPSVKMNLKRPGFYPAGGGRFTVEIQPVEKLDRIELIERGDITARRAKAYVANLPEQIGHRELKVIKQRLNWDKNWLELVEVKDSIGPGNLVTAEVRSENVTEMFTGFGMRSVPADKVPVPLVKEAREYLAAGVPVGRHLADQLLIPFAMAGGGRFRTVPLTMHSLTNIETIKKFLDVDFEVEKLDKDLYEVRVIRNKK